jgi:hypothetical protein
MVALDDPAMCVNNDPPVLFPWFAHWIAPGLPDIQRQQGQPYDDDALKPIPPAGIVVAHDSQSLFVACSMRYGEGDGDGDASQSPDRIHSIVPAVQRR